MDGVVWLCVETQGVLLPHKNVSLDDNGAGRLFDPGGPGGGDKFCQVPLSLQLVLSLAFELFSQSGG